MGTRGLVSAAGARPGCTACLPASLGRHSLPHSVQAPGRGKLLPLFRRRHLGSLTRALNGWALCQTYPPASFPSAFSSSREEAGGSGGSGRRGAVGALGRHLPLAGISGTGCAPSSGWHFRHWLWGRHLPDSWQHSQPAALRRACSQAPVLPVVQVSSLSSLY